MRGGICELLDEIEAEAGSVDLAGAEGAAEQACMRTAETMPGAVDLMTIHGAKGLEWDVVMVPGLERTCAELREGTAADLETEMRETRAMQRRRMWCWRQSSGKGEESQELNEWLNGIHRCAGGCGAEETVLCGVHAGSGGVASVCFAGDEAER